MGKKIILLSGVHGVGKGYFLRKILSEDERFTVLTASELIGKVKTSDDAGHKKVKNISDNQQILLEALMEEKRKTEKDIILDGHLCILNGSGEIERIQEWFIERASINGIILLQGETDTILHRQELRDSIVLPRNTISLIQQSEEKYCQDIYLKYGIRYKIIYETCDYPEFCDMIDEMEGDLNESKY